MNQNYFVCDGCGYIGKGEPPVKCPVCRAEGNRFKQVDQEHLRGGGQDRGCAGDRPGLR